jgi:hypothetical protein
MSEHLARRLFELTEPIAVVTYLEPEATEAVMALGPLNGWDAYFAGRAAPLGRDVPPTVVHALFYNFADGEVARHLPSVWAEVTPEAAIAARQEGSVASLRRLLGPMLAEPDVDTGIVRAADLLTRAGTSAATEGRALFAAVRTLPVPDAPLARLWHGANLLREHRGDGHVAALVAHGIGGTEAHVLHALSEGMRPEAFGRIGHLPRPQLAAVIEGLRARGLVGDDGRLTPAGRQAKADVEALTDRLAAPAYDALSGEEVDELVAILEPLVAVLEASG